MGHSGPVSSRQSNLVCYRLSRSFPPPLCQLPIYSNGSFQRPLVSLLGTSLSLSRANNSLKNFQDYLQFKEHSTENLLFWNWYKRYRMRFHNLPDHERNLSPAPLLSNHYVGPTSPVESRRIPKLRINGTNKTIGGDFSRSAELTTVPNLPLSCH